MDEFEHTSRVTELDSAEPELTSKSKTSKSPTQEVYAAYEKAFNALNRDLFAGELPRPLKTLRGNRSSGGHVKADGLKDGQGDALMELAVRPAEKDAEPLDVLIRFVHQMLRVWQQKLGVKVPPRANYHNGEFAAKAREIGLNVSVPDGREGQITGDRIELSVIAGGAFEKAAGKLLRSGWDVPLREVVEAVVPEKRGGQRKKMVCPRCAENVLTSNAEPICGGCYRETDKHFWMEEESTFLEAGGLFKLSEEERKEVRQARRKTAEQKMEAQTREGDES